MMMSIIIHTLFFIFYLIIAKVSNLLKDKLCLVNWNCHERLLLNIYTINTDNLGISNPNLLAKNWSNLSIRNDLRNLKKTKQKYVYFLKLHCFMYFLARFHVSSTIITHATAKNTKVLPSFMVWKFWGTPYFPLQNLCVSTKFPQSFPILPIFAAMETKNPMSRTVTMSLAAWNFFNLFIIFCIFCIYLVLFFSLLFNIVYSTSIQ